MDDELRQQFQALSALIKSVDLKTDALSTQIESVDRKTEALSTLVESLDRKTEALSTLIESVKESLEREIGTVRETVLRMATRLDKIAAGAHYVTRLVEWSESQDAYQLDILHRVQALESRQDKKQG
jgi:ABC-type transporter Mla subunit MlaD